VHTAAADVEAAGGKALAVVGDVRREEDVVRVVEAAVQRFGGVDVCVNNASAIAVDPTAQLSANPHVLTISPPVNMNPRWLGAHPSYTLSKYGMTLLSLGWAAEFADAGIGVNCLWPQTYIATAAVANMGDGNRLAESSRSPEIMADAAVAIISRPAREATGNCHIDAEVLQSIGVSDLSRYGGGDRRRIRPRELLRAADDFAVRNCQPAIRGRGPGPPCRGDFLELCGSGQA
jgi:citronellol/citronellal dehydrogenase